MIDIVMRVVQKYEQNADYIWNNRHVFGCIGKLTCRNSRISKYLSMLYYRLTRNVIYKRLFIFVMSAQSTWRDRSGSKQTGEGDFVFTEMSDLTAYLLA